MKRAVVIGATGAIGTALVKKLIQENIETLVITRIESKRNDNIPSDPLIIKKYCSLENLSKLQNDTGKFFDVFYNLAWMGASGDGRNDMYLQNANVKYALDAVEIAKRFGCKKYIGAGSQAEYGRYEGKLKPETSTFPEIGYGYAKLCAGQMTREYAHQQGIQHIWVRILSVYGPNDGDQSMIMSAISKFKAGEVPEFTKGEQMWDYLYSGDAAKAFYLLGDLGIDGKIYVLGSGKARPLAEYIKEIRDVISPQSKLELGAIPYSDKQVMYLCADISEIEKDTGWKAETDFTDGIRSISETL